ncbi:MAG TPA: GNAT family N-acetyltransferase [Pedobacter sp.]|jgi:GNAT superfamily N-acetyltransferase
MNILPLKNDDLNQLSSIQPEGWPAILPHFNFYLNAAYCFPINVIKDNTIIGVGTTIIHHDVAWLAHIIVHAYFRNQGLGRIITEKLIEIARTRNCKTIYLIATDLGAYVYQKVGFITEMEYIFFKDLKFQPVVDFSPNIKIFNDIYKEQLTEMDIKVSGEDRMQQLEQHLASAWCYVKNNILEGYYLPNLGEGLIAATNPQAGIELMKMRLCQSNHAAFPVDNFEASAFLLKHGNSPFKKAKRMRFGIEKEWQPGNMYNRIGGNIG